MERNHGIAKCNWRWQGKADGEIGQCGWTTRQTKAAATHVQITPEYLTQNCSPTSLTRQTNRNFPVMRNEAKMTEKFNFSAMGQRALCRRYENRLKS